MYVWYFSEKSIILCWQNLPYSEGYPIYKQWHWREGWYICWSSSLRGSKGREVKMSTGRILRRPILPRLIRSSFPPLRSPATQAIDQGKFYEGKPFKCSADKLFKETLFTQAIDNDKFYEGKPFKCSADIFCKETLFSQETKTALWHVIPG